MPRSGDLSNQHCLSGKIDLMYSRLVSWIMEKLRLELNFEGWAESEGLYKQNYSRGKEQTRFGLWMI